MVYPENETSRASLPGPVSGFGRELQTRSPDQIAAASFSLDR